MRGIKIPQQEFVLKMQGGVFVGHYGNNKHLMQAEINGKPTGEARKYVE